MKSLMAGLIMLFAGVSAHAKMNCVDMWGQHVFVKFVSSKQIQLTFESKKYPSSGTLDFNGSDSSNYYYMGITKYAELEKSIFQQGTGKIYYRYSPNTHPNKTVIEFTCN